MVRVLQRAAAANRDESGVAIFGKDHSSRQPLAPSAQLQACDLHNRWPDPTPFCVGHHRKDPHTA
jgi:hypothetical protein